MEEQDKIIVLYDYYSELFSDMQKKYFEAYYFDNLSLSEIAINEDKSRNAVHKSIKSVVSKLYEYEDKLKLYSKEQRLKQIISEINDSNLKKELEGLLWEKDYQ